MNSVCPSFTLTNMTKDSAKDRKLMAEVKKRMPIGRIAMPEDIAAVILFLASDDAAYLAGETIEINGGMFMR